MKKVGVFYILPTLDKQLCQNAWRSAGSISVEVAFEQEVFDELLDGSDFWSFHYENRQLEDKIR